jgi:hypothetical protein
MPSTIAASASGFVRFVFLERVIPGSSLVERPVERFLPRCRRRLRDR